MCSRFPVAIASQILLLEDPTGCGAAVFPDDLVVADDDGARCEVARK